MLVKYANSPGAHQGPPLVAGILNNRVPVPARQAAYAFGDPIGIRASLDKVLVGGCCIVSAEIDMDLDVVGVASGVHGVDHSICDGMGRE